MNYIKQVCCISLIALICSNLYSAELDEIAKIDTLFEVELNGIEQKVLVQSNNLDNPVLLFLHGVLGLQKCLLIIIV